MDRSLIKGKKYWLWKRYVAKYVGEREHGLLGTQYQFELDDIYNSPIKVVWADLDSVTPFED